MAAWVSSPYRALGVYIGGANRACSQPNLTPAWVSEQVSEGWRLMPDRGSTTANHYDHVHIHVE